MPGMMPATTTEFASYAQDHSTTHSISSFGQDRASLGSLSVPNTLPEAVQAELRVRGHVVTASRGGVGGGGADRHRPQDQARHRRGSGSRQNQLDSPSGVPPPVLALAKPLQLESHG